MQSVQYDARARGVIVWCYWFEEIYDLDNRNSNYAQQHPQADQVECHLEKPRKISHERRKHHFLARYDAVAYTNVFYVGIRLHKRYDCIQCEVNYTSDDRNEDLRIIYSICCHFA